MILTYLVVMQIWMYTMSYRTDRGLSLLFSCLVYLLNRVEIYVLIRRRWVISVPTFHLPNFLFILNTKNSKLLLKKFAWSRGLFGLWGTSIWPHSFSFGGICKRWTEELFFRRCVCLYVSLDLRYWLLKMAPASFAETLEKITLWCGNIPKAEGTYLYVLVVLFLLLYSVFAKYLSQLEKKDYPRKPSTRAVAEIPMLSSVSGYLFKLML
jgi:hypothetical protein